MDLSLPCLAAVLGGLEPDEAVAVLVAECVARHRVLAWLAEVVPPEGDADAPESQHASSEDLGKPKPETLTGRHPGRLQVRALSLSLSIASGLCGEKSGLFGNVCLRNVSAGEIKGTYTHIHRLFASERERESEVHQRLERPTRLVEDRENVRGYMCSQESDALFPR